MKNTKKEKEAQPTHQPRLIQTLGLVFSNQPPSNGLSSSRCAGLM
jgi:hypothetical protein